MRMCKFILNVHDVWILLQSLEKDIERQTATIARLEKLVRDIELRSQEKVRDRLHNEFGSVVFQGRGCLSVCLSVYLSIYILTHLLVCLFLCLLFTNVFIYLLVADV